MKVLKCSNCGHTTNTLVAEVTIEHRLEMNKYGIFYVDNDFNTRHFDPVKPKSQRDIKNRNCWFCHRCSKCALSIVDVDECPHDWWLKYTSTRECSICGKIEEGRVTFND